MEKLTSDYAWKVYNFIDHYKAGDFGIITLQEAIDMYFETWTAPQRPKCQIGDCV